MAEVELRGVDKRFGETHAIKGMNLSVASGEFVVLLGPTGAGKTTTLRLVAGLERADTGAILIDGTDVTALPPATRNVAFVFQQYSLYPHYSVYDNMAFPLRAPGMRLSKDEIHARVREVAGLLHIEDKLRNRATQLSGGEMQRVAIGRALVRQPTIFLMDEPLSSLDAKLREDLRVELKRIQRDLGATILYVTHDQLEAMTLADRIGVLREGELVQIDRPRAVYESPRNVYVARRLGSPQINLLDVGLLDAGSHAMAGAPSGAAQVGLRPEDVLLRCDGGAAATVLAIEHLGVETIVVLDVAGCRVHSLLGSAAPFSVGDSTHIQVRPRAAIFFDANGDRIATRPPGKENPEAAYGT
ncbi:MAG: ABC transporter ATP-binding protein [Kiloniellaceae bacterium]